MRLFACLIVAPQRGYDEPAILSHAISSFCPTSADGLHVSNMVRHYREQSDGLEVAPAILLGLYCAVSGCFAFGLYALHQPTRLSNPSLSVYQFPPVTIVTYALSPRLSDAPQPIPWSKPRRRNRKRPAERRSGGTTSKNPIARLSRNV